MLRLFDIGVGCTTFTVATVYCSVALLPQCPVYSANLFIFIVQITLIVIVLFLVLGIADFDDLTLPRYDETVVTLESTVYVLALLLNSRC